MTCDCVEEVNKVLAEHNTCLDTLTMINMQTGLSRQSLHVATTKLHRARGKAKVMLVTFCPFCGQRSAPEPASRSALENADA